VPTSVTPGSPRAAANHTRSVSTMLTVAMGVPQTVAASSAMSSKVPSGGVSRIS
jgi:hypothetical protein